MFGTFIGLHESNIGHRELVWSYKQAFEAMTNVEYQNNNKLFDSQLIQTLKKQHLQNNRITVDDFKQIPAKCILSMFKHEWIFQDWTTNEIWNAIIFSMQSKNNDRIKGRKENQKFRIILKIIDKLTKMGHILYPFCSVSYSEEINRKLAEPQVVLYKKCRGIQQKDITKSYMAFLQHFKIGILPTNKSEIDDLNIIAELLYLTLTRDERFCVLQRLWINTTIYKQTIYKALCHSDINDQPLWDKNITLSIIASYL